MNEYYFDLEPKDVLQRQECLCKSAGVKNFIMKNYGRLKNMFGKKKPSILSRAGQVVKNHPVATAVGVGTLGLTTGLYAGNKMFSQKDRPPQYIPAKPPHKSPPAWDINWEMDLPGIGIGSLGGALMGHQIGTQLGNPWVGAGIGAGIGGAVGYGANKILV